MPRLLPAGLLLAALCLAPACQDGGARPDAGGDADQDGATDCPGCWRSSLYPEDWTPASTDAEGRFLHDFSYAGYHLGEAEPPAEPPGPRVSALDQGADPSGQTDSTAALQAALDQAGQAGGGVVELPEGLYRCDGLLVVRRSGVVLRGAGAGLTRVYFTRAGDMSGLASLSFQGQPTLGPDLPLAEDASPRSLEVRVQDPAGLAPGDDVELGAVITGDFIAEHGMTGVWQASAGQWRAFFRRTVAAVEGSAPPFTVRLDAPVRYPLKTRDGASLRAVDGLLAEVGVEDLALSNAVDLASARASDRAHVLLLDQVEDAWVRRVASFASTAGEGGRHLQSGGILVQRSKRVSVLDTVLERAQNRGSGGNGYLFELMQSGEVLVRDCQGLDGRHNFIQNWDFGTSGCVFLRVESRGGLAESELGAVTGLSEYHHSLAMANLVDGAVSDDGWGAVNRGQESSGAGHSATQDVFWNVQGGLLRSYQYGWGFVIGTRGAIVYTDPADDLLGDLAGQAAGTEPLDWVEGLDQGDGLRPVSLYEDQRARRLSLPPP
ncbi:MAG TPA: glycosyl hydrolase family 28-related protein [Myxococcota bacterium]|nr:glycosyl hydrolase family 28-related protein [Myxococcota bacterium]HRY96384.1 glycosyl hydrolase family 28-related protein [Myxococcota bacterium]HSA23032.1 glycosyl hydrolase family 28-related protein [Myxococcota bacterium]